MTGTLEVTADLQRADQPFALAGGVASRHSVWVSPGRDGDDRPKNRWWRLYIWIALVPLAVGAAASAARVVTGGGDLGRGGWLLLTAFATTGCFVLWLLMRAFDA